MKFTTVDDNPRSRLISRTFKGRTNPKPIWNQPFLLRFLGTGEVLVFNPPSTHPHLRTPMPTKSVHSSTPVPHLLRSNVEPSSQEIVSVRRTIKNAEERMREDFLDSNKDGRRLHATYASFIHHHNAILSPIRQVPVEIWEEIFRYVTHHDDTGHSGISCRLGEVCRLWNIASKSVPRLLGALPPLQLTKQNATLSFIQALQKHISIIPETNTISLRISGPITSDEHPALQILCAHSQRWRTLSISINPSAFGLLYRSLQQGVHNLTTL